MPPNHRPSDQRLKSVAPTNHLLFDPWNSASSGHQRSDSNPGTAWRRTREAKLEQQFRSGGDCTIQSFGYDGRTRRFGVEEGKGGERGEWVWDWGNHGGKGGAAEGKTGPGLGSKQRDIRSMMRVKKDSSISSGSQLEGKGVRESAPVSTSTSMPPPSQQQQYEPLPDQTPGAFSGFPNTTTITPTTSKTLPTPSHLNPTTLPQSESKILANTTIYINGQTAPMISDHKLKTLLVSHGATLSLGLSRRVTHVIIGKPNSGPERGGAGGGLAAGKIQKEIGRGGWWGIRIVGVEWVLESIKAGKRLPETRFAVNLTNQRSVLRFM